MFNKISRTQKDKHHMCSFKSSFKLGLGCVYVRSELEKESREERKLS